MWLYNMPRVFSILISFSISAGVYSQQFYSISGKKYELKGELVSTLTYPEDKDEKMISYISFTSDSIYVSYVHYHTRLKETYQYSLLKMALKDIDTSRFEVGQDNFYQPMAFSLSIRTLGKASKVNSFMKIGGVAREMQNNLSSLLVYFESKSDAESFLKKIIERIP